jgi:hypothetical protein
MKKMIAILTLHGITFGWLRTTNPQIGFHQDIQMPYLFPTFQSSGENPNSREETKVTMIDEISGVGIYSYNNYY